MSRKIFADLPAPGSQPTESGATPRRQAMRPLMAALENEAQETGRRSPVGALGQSLGEMSERTKRAEEIERRLSAGQIIVELDVADVEPSFVPDRMQVDDEAFGNFVQSIKAEGQQVPILVRPHPEKANKYQIAFGHRRWRAAKALDRPIKAVVRSLTDQELVIAQGQENNERQDLSYIEKALFARRLDRQFSRDVITSALAVYSSDLSNMLSVANRVPDDLIESVGPAHSVGRRSWMALANLLTSKLNVAKARKLAAEASFGKLASKERFGALFEGLSEKSPSHGDATAVSHAGREVGRIAETKQRVTLTVDRKVSPEFASFVLNELPRLFELHQKQQGQGGG